MMGSVSRFWMAPAAALLVLAGCTTSAPMAEVTRFHLGQPIPADAIALVPAPGAQPFNLEYRAYADALTADLAAAGFRAVNNDGRSAYIGVLTVEQTTRAGLPRSSPFRIGIGGGGFSGGGGGGVGLGGGISLPVGKARPNDIRVNMLALQIKRRSDNSIVWEGRAVQQIAADAAAASLTAAVPALSRALLSGFPGPTGQTVRVPTGQTARVPASR